MFTIGLLDISLRNLLAMKLLVLVAGGVHILTFVVWLILTAVSLAPGDGTSAWIHGGIIFNGDYSEHLSEQRADRYAARETDSGNSDQS